ncbi:MAG: hypothetical protein E6K74_03200 [Candidatus Eisenbacteria bacterium]|uniref:Uncharacterized protein n=1 Tax=Eiseniibacteriota bacterium TaxID=2212470 RepID=A0A538SVR1_UNCEI|nr:MAG: hypothetical protein E6K74_03200 [Candidatus Eisenbacteria bacterium]
MRPVRVMSQPERIGAQGALYLPAWALLLPLAFAFAPHAAAAADLLETNPDSTLTVTIQKIEGAPISLDEAQRSALIQATRVREAEAAMRAARGTLRHESGAFDPELFLDAHRVGIDQPTASPFSGGDSLPSGASVAPDFRFSTRSMTPTAC